MHEDMKMYAILGKWQIVQYVGVYNMMGVGIGNEDKWICWGYIVKRSEFQAKVWKLSRNNRSLLEDFKLGSLQTLLQRPYKKGFSVGETRERRTR